MVAQLLKKGYKMTEAGIIPEEWEIKVLGDITTSIASGKSKTSSEMGDCPIYGSTGIIGYKKHGDYTGNKILVARVGANAGTVNKVNGTYCVSDNTLMITYSSNIDVDFSYYQLVNYNLNKMMFGTGQPLITGSQLKKMTLPFPSTKVEQSAIAKVLSDTDSLIKSLDNLIEKKKNIKQGAMQELLTGNKHLPGFSEEWKIVKLSNIGIFKKGKGIKRDDMVDDGIPCIRYGEIYTHHSDIIKQYFSFISPQIAKSSQRIEKGDLMFTGSGETAEEIGKCVAFLGDDEVYAGGDVLIFTPRNVDSTFLGYLMNHSSIVKQKAKLAQGDVIVHIYKKNLGELVLSLPPKEEQSAIAQVLSEMDSEIEALEQKRDKYKQLKVGLMQQLLTGRIRLKCKN